MWPWSAGLVTVVEIESIFWYSPDLGLLWFSFLFLHLLRSLISPFPLILFNVPLLSWDLSLLTVLVSSDRLKVNCFSIVCFSVLPYETLSKKKQILKMVFLCSVSIGSSLIFCLVECVILQMYIISNSSIRRLVSQLHSIICCLVCVFMSFYCALKAFILQLLLAQGFKMRFQSRYEKSL